MILLLDRGRKTEDGKEIHHEGTEGARRKSRGAEGGGDYFPKKHRDDVGKKLTEDGRREIESRS
jgi:hypothetical protein